MPFLVRQQHKMGCGIAVLAMLTGQTYEQVFEDFGSPDLTGENGGTSDCEMRDYLKRHGLKFGGWRLKQYIGGEETTPWPPEPTGEVCLCLVHVYPWSPCSHWVVMLPDGAILDPVNLADTPLRLTAYDAVSSVVAIVKENPDVSESN